MTARILFSLVVGTSLLASAALVCAQGGPPPQGRPMAGPGGPRGGGGRMQKFMDDEYKKLKVSASQKKKIDAYSAHTMRAMEAYRKAHPNMKRGDMRPMMEKSRAERTAFMKKTLNGKQFKQYEADMAAMRAKFGGRRGGPRGGAAGRPNMVPPPGH